MHSDGGFRLERLANGWLAGRFAALEAAGLVHLVTTRQGPDVQQVRHDPAAAGREIAHVLGFEDAAFLEQVHGGEVVVCEKGGCAGFADGLVTATPGLSLVGKSGDCPIMLLGDRRGRAVGFAHASWRATVAGITPTVVRRMADLGCDASDLVACICPSVGPECYEVGEEVRATAVDRHRPSCGSVLPTRPDRKTPLRSLARQHGCPDSCRRSTAVHPRVRRLHAVPQRPVSQPSAGRSRRRTICRRDCLAAGSLKAARAFGMLVGTRGAFLRAVCESATWIDGDDLWRTCGRT